MRPKPKDNPPGNGEDAKNSDETNGKHADSARTADTKADTEQNSLPDSPDVLDLCKLLKKELRKGRSAIDIAREFVSGNEEKAQSLLRQTRRYKYLYK